MFLPFINPYKYIRPWPSYFIRTYFTAFKYLGYGYGEPWKFTLASILLLLLLSWVCFTSSWSCCKKLPVQCKDFTLATLCKRRCFLFSINFYYDGFLFWFFRFKWGMSAGCAMTSPLSQLMGCFQGLQFMLEKETEF